ncbi:MAG: hypothetical protein ACHRHE_14925 [Tepidisphaerales bacterium]
MAAMVQPEPFPTVHKLAREVGATWPGYELAVKRTVAAEQRLHEVLLSADVRGRPLGADASLVLFGSFARREMLDGSDYDWALLLDGVVDNDHAVLGRRIEAALVRGKLKSPGSSGTFGNLVFSHDLVHRIGGGADSNANLTRRMLMLLESRPFSLSPADSADPVWENVLGNILQRYFEEDVHFAPSGRRTVPRFLLNDLTRYWRTVAVDYAAKHREQGGKKWAVRNAKLRFSRKLLFASGLAFCLSCQLDPPAANHENLFGMPPHPSADPFIARAKAFARTPPLEYLAAFVDAFVLASPKRAMVVNRIFGSYDWWLGTMGDESTRTGLEALDHGNAGADAVFQEIRTKGTEFARGLELLFFNRNRDDEQDTVARLALQYIGF